MGKICTPCDKPFGFVAPALQIITISNSASNHWGDGDLADGDGAFQALDGSYTYYLKKSVSIAWSGTSSCSNDAGTSKWTWSGTLTRDYTAASPFTAPKSVSCTGEYDAVYNSDYGSDHFVLTNYTKCTGTGQTTSGTRTGGTECTPPYDTEITTVTPPTPTEAITTVANSYFTQVTTTSLTNEFTLSDLRDLAIAGLPAWPAWPSISYPSAWSPASDSAYVDVPTDLSQYTEKRLKWRLAFVPNGLCYLKVWVRITSVVTGGATTHTDVTHEWIGTGDTCFTVPDDPYNAVPNLMFSGENEVDPPTLTAAGEVTITPSVLKYTFVKDYIPPDDGSANGYPQ